MKTIYNIIRKIRKVFEKIVNMILFHYFGVDLGGKTYHIEGILTIRADTKHSITIGKNVEFRSGKKYNIIGGDTRLILRTYRGGKIAIGNNVGISNSSLVSMNNIIIEDDVMIGGSCKIWNTDFHSLNMEQRMESYDTNIQSAPIRIKRGAFIGACSIVLKGVTIGEKSIVGAGSVVTKSIPDGEIWGGAPAKFIRKI
ncbi:acyltransferase [Clostridium sp. AWRP]|uniref:acyltransferase n=1 Tax=Clostridium sp. AWRP TaxID=2212991 RepID=UPI000FD865D1|nr:acyltransferase [Clostridium sp. AWRP]AZV55533.1 acyltransferase [Clostridium sp. AWRP]